MKTIARAFCLAAALGSALFTTSASAQFTPRRVTLTPGASVGIDASLGSIFLLTPGQDETITVSNPGLRTFYVFVTQTGTSRTLTFSTGFTSVSAYATGVGAGVCSLAFQGTGTTVREVAGSCRPLSLGAPGAYQASDADLDALAALSTTGMLARIGAATYVPRTIAGTSNEIAVTNGDGVSGAPTVGLAATIDLTGKTSTKPNKSGSLASMPGSCTAGETYFCTSGCTDGLQGYGCGSGLTFVLQGDAGGAGALASINGEGGPAITIAAGTTGSDVNVATTTNTITVHVPDAGAAARGVITTGAQTIAGAKTFSSTIVGAISGNAATVTGLSVTAGKTVTATESSTVGGRIAQYVADGTTGAVSFTSISAAFTNLEVRWSARDTKTANSQLIAVRLNNDTTSGNYTGGRYITSGGTVLTGANGNGCSGGIIIAEIPAASTTANYFSDGIFSINNYTSTSGFKTVIFHGAGTTTATPTETETVANFRWKSTAAVSRIDICTDGTNFATGSVFTLYGMP
jgi:hypothetical protein